MTTSAPSQETVGGVVHWRAHPGRVITPMGLALALSLLGDATLYTVLPTHTADAGIALSTVGIILGVNRAVRLLLNTPVGMLYDTWPRRWIFLPAAAIGVVSTVIYALSGSFWPLLAGRLLWGLAWSGLWVGAQAITLDVSSSGNGGRLMGWTQAWFFLGGAVSFMVGGYLTDLLSYRHALVIGAGLSAIGVIAATLFLPETRPREAPGSHHRRSQSTSSKWQRVAGMAPQVRQGAWVPLYGYALMRFCQAGVLTATLGLFVQQHLGRQASLAGVVVGAATLNGLLLGMRPVLSLVVAPWAGRLSDRRGRWALMRWGALAGSASFIVLIAGTLPAILVNGLLGATSMGMLQPVASTLTGELSPLDAQGRNLGWLATAGDLGSALGPVVGYVLLPWLGLANIYLACAVLMATLWLISLGR